MKLKLNLVLFLLLCGGWPAHAQQVSGTITAVDTQANCTTAGGYVSSTLLSNSSTIAFQVSSTYSGTLNFVVTLDGSTWSPANAYPPNSTTAVTSTTGTGKWKVDAGGWRGFCVYASALASGTPTVLINQSPGVSTSTLSGGGGGGSGFPITLGSTSIASGSSTGSISGLTLVAPALGTPTALALTNATALPSATANSAVQALTGCNTANYVYTPQASACVAGAPPTGAAGGSLAGTYPNPGFAEGASLPGISAIAFGATGSGTMSGSVISGTDDTTALQTWANYCATNGVRCYLPSPSVNHCYRITHLIFAKSGPSGSNSGWPTQETSFEVFGDGMDSQYNLTQRQFQKSTFCSTDTTDPAIQANSLSVNPAGSYSSREYKLHDFSVIQSTSTAVMPIIAMNGVNDSSIIQRVRVDQVGIGSGIVWANVWLNSGVRDSNIYSEQTSPTTGSKGLWLYNDDSGAPGGGQVIADGNETIAFDRGTQIGTVGSATGSFFASADTYSSLQIISSVSLHNADSEQNNYEFVFGQGVDGLEMGPWYSESGLVEDIILTGGAKGINIHNGYTYEPNTSLGEIGFDGGAGGAECPGRSIIFENNDFSSVSKYFLNGPGTPGTAANLDCGAPTGAFRWNYMYAHTASGSICLNVYVPVQWTAYENDCENFATVSTDTTDWINYAPHGNGFPQIFAGIVDGKAPVTITAGASCTLGTASGCNATAYSTGFTFNQEATAAAAITYTLPTAAAGKSYCVSNSYNGSAATTGTLELLTSATGQFVIFTDGTLSATGGYVISAGAAGDAACVEGVDATHWQLYVNRGTWTKH